MDDTTFDQQTALDWINCIETEGKTFRDDDVYPMLKCWLDKVLPVSVLDIGCGQGICSDKVLWTGSKYTGVEPSLVLLKRAQELYSSPQRTFLVGNAYQLPFLEGEFDAAFSVLVWHLLKDLQLAVTELSRVLTVNGNFMIITANPGAYSTWKSLYSDFKLNGNRLEGTMLLQGVKSHDTLYLHTIEDIHQSLQSAGLVVDDVVTFRPSMQGTKEHMFISIQGKKITMPTEL